MFRLVRLLVASAARPSFSTRAPILNHHGGERYLKDEPTLAHIGKHHEGEDSWMSTEEVEDAQMKRHEDPSHYSNRQHRTPGDMRDMQDDITKLFIHISDVERDILKLNERISDVEDDSLDQAETVQTLEQSLNDTAQNLMDNWEQTAKLPDRMKESLRWTMREEIQRAREDKLNTFQN